MSQKIAQIESLTSQLFREKWKRFHDDDALSDPKLKFPGVYLLAYTHRNLERERVNPSDVLYVGMSNAQGGVRVRLRQFRDGIERNDLHSGAMRFYREYLGGRPWASSKSRKKLFFVAVSVECVSEKSNLAPADLRELGHVCCLEYYAIARVRQKTGYMPPLNKFGKRPVAKSVSG